VVLITEAPGRPGGGKRSFPIVMPRLRKSVPFLIAALLLAWIAQPGGAHGGGDHSAHGTGGGRITVREASYEIPAVELVDQKGGVVALPELVNGKRPIVLEFIFATCTTICPVLTATLAGFQDRLGGEEARRPQLVSITIDPEHDTPEVLAAYAERFGADAGWLFLTGSRRDVDRVMKAFDVYEPDKMNHRPVVFLKPPGPAPWTRLEGLFGAEELLRRYRGLEAQ